MLTTEKRRIREAPETSGMISYIGAERKYHARRSTLKAWVEKGEVKIAKAAAFPGDTVLLDEDSLRKRLQTYTPHKDNTSRRRPGPPNPIPAPTPLTANGQAHGVGTNGGPPTTAPPASPLILNTREQVDEWYRQKKRGHGGKLNADTKQTYDMVFDRFCQKFPILDMGNPFSLREDILNYLHGLTNVKNGEPLADGTKDLHHKRINDFIKWLGRGNDFKVPDMTHNDLSSVPVNVGVFKSEEIRAMLKYGAREHSEYTFVLWQAMTGGRISEYLTMRPELLGDHWIPVWGKVTVTNKTGYREIALPDPLYEHIKKEFDFRGELVWTNSFGKANPLAGPIERENPRRSIDLEAPETYRVSPIKGGRVRMGQVMERIMRDAEVEHEPGKLNHAFRRAYSKEFLKNAGNSPTAKIWLDRILGHRKLSDMTDRYLYLDIADLVEQAQLYAPRSFLKELAPQGELALVGG